MRESEERKRSEKSTLREVKCTYTKKDELEL